MRVFLDGVSLIGIQGTGFTLSVGWPWITKMGWYSFIGTAYPVLPLAYADRVPSLL